MHYGRRDTRLIQTWGALTTSRASVQEVDLHNCSCEENVTQKRPPRNRVQRLERRLSQPGWRRAVATGKRRVVPDHAGHTNQSLNERDSSKQPVIANF